MSLLGALASGACQAEPTLEAAASTVIEHIRDRDFSSLAAAVHPELGVRFSPYAYVDSARDIVFLPEAIRSAADDPTVYRWGARDGTGEPIDLTISEYFDQFVYDVDFASAEQVGYDEQIGRGNSIINARQAYPDGALVEYHFPGFDPELDGLDWRSLRLVFEQHGSSWHLVGVIHDQWTT